MLIFLRHGRTLSNDKKELCGKTNPRLTDVGISQGIFMGNCLKNFNIKTIISSSTQRTIQTAKLINKNVNAEFKIDNRLRERDYGIFEMMNIDTLVEKRKSLNHKFLDPSQDWNNVNQVESDSAVYTRILKLIKEEYSKKEDYDILFITHAGTIKSYLYEMLNILPSTPNCIKIRNSSLIIFDYDNNQIQLKGIYDYDIIKQIQNQ